MARTTVVSEVNGAVWKIVVKVGDKVAQDDPLIYAESMKMEIPMLAPDDGVVSEILVSEGQALAEGTPVMILET